MNTVDLNDVKKFYNKIPEIWASYDHWHLWSLSQIDKYLKKVPLKGNILNAGSGGNDYNISCQEMIHVDIAEKKLEGIPNAIVSNIESMPFQESNFDGIICVGSVINYCDASAVIAEFSRVAKPNAILILEFESSAGYEYRKQAAYKKAAAVVTVQFQGEEHTQWLYSLSYIKSLLQANSFSIQDIYPYQICSSLALSINRNENKAIRYAYCDIICRKIPFLSNHANNFILWCKKL